MRSTLSAGGLEAGHDALVTLHRFTLATAEQLHQPYDGAAGSAPRSG